MDKVKILVVDDESRMRKLVKDFLARAHFEVLEAADGEEALDLFYQDKEIALMGRLPGSAGGVEGPDYHADGKRR